MSGAVVAAVLLYSTGIMMANHEPVRESMMGKLFDDIRSAVASNRYVIGIHAAQRLRERRIPQWQAIAGLESGKLLVERAEAKPNAVVEVEQSLPNGTTVKAVWAWLSYHQAAKLVTVHLMDR